QVKEQVKEIILVVKCEQSANEIMELLSLKGRRNFLQNYLQPAVESGSIEMTQPDSPKSPTQKYRLSDKGKKILHQLNRK
ncbi:MAG: hypothetical protein KAI81_02425, partial [Candidatus Marinimicrobia bacterium]|nr:hypothetical protein [Candidatus Neomarinimicrobiota bacterium]